jgi:predicted ester cyclase
LGKAGLFFYMVPEINLQVFPDVATNGCCYDSHMKNESGRNIMSTEQNKAKYRQFIEQAWNKGNIDVLDELAAPDLLLHFLPPGTPPGGESMKRFITSLRAAFPDVSITVEDLFAEGDRTIARYTMSGTQRGPFLNQLKTLTPPSDKRFSVAGIDSCRFDANGKWVECWASFDQLGMLQQLGAIPMAGPSPVEASPSALAPSLHGKA